MKKTVVITGGSRGIGRGMVLAFARLGWNVVFTGRDDKSIKKALDGLNSLPEMVKCRDSVVGVPCLVDQPEQIEAVWNSALARFGQVDVWINNAGTSIPAEKFWLHTKENIDTVVDTNLKGIMVTTMIVTPRMIGQGFGFLYFMEGLGSDGRSAPHMNLYGTTKYALAYFARTLAKETLGTPVCIGALSPGMVITDLLLADVGGVDTTGNPAGEIPVPLRRLYNILADRVETVSPWLAGRVVADVASGRKPGSFRLHAWLTTPKIFGRFLTAGIHPRHIL